MDCINNKEKPLKIESSEPEIISEDLEKEIFEETCRRLKTDTFVAFAFKRSNDRVWLSRYIMGKINEKYLLWCIEETIRFYRLAEKSAEELNAVFDREKKDIDEDAIVSSFETLSVVSETLFQLEMDEFVESIKKMDAEEQRIHLLYAKDMLSKLTDQLEEISYQIAEREKHAY